jgi:tRNA dimethylallyltransferase
MTGKKTVLVIGGPTASGKSRLAVAVAENFSGVVINADSMQVYDGLPLLTAQPSAGDIKQVPHRLYGALPPDKICSAVIWRDMALAEIEKAHAEKKLPIIVGGTGFYLKTLLKGVSPIPDVPPDVRKKFIQMQREMGNPAFHAAFAEKDPVMAAKLDPFNTQRIVRAWEVLEGTGKSLAEWQAAPPQGAPENLRFLSAALLPLRETLYASCNARFGQMLEKGALDEAKDFKKRFPDSVPLAKALGYPELSAHIEGKLNLADAAAAAQQSTRNYAKRQMTWFRHQLKPDLVFTDPACGKQDISGFLESL